MGAVYPDLADRVQLPRRRMASGLGNVEVMSMDRLRRILAGGMLAMMLGTVVTASGCRSTGNEVPPGPKYSTTGDPASSVKFNSDPHPYNGVGSIYGNSPVPGQPNMPTGGGLAGPVSGDVTRWPADRAGSGRVVSVRHADPRRAWHGTADG